MVPPPPSLASNVDEGKVLPACGAQCFVFEKKGFHQAQSFRSIASLPSRWMKPPPLMHCASPAATAVNTLHCAVGLTYCGWVSREDCHLLRWHCQCRCECSAHYKFKGQGRRHWWGLSESQLHILTWNVQQRPTEGTNVIQCGDVEMLVRFPRCEKLFTSVPLDYTGVIYSLWIYCSVQPPRTKASV